MRYVGSGFSRPPSRFHSWLVSELDPLHRRRGTKLNVLAPRGAAKSTWVSFAYPLKAALHEEEAFILLLSDSGEQADKYLESIRLELESNEAILRDYPQAAGVGPVWRQNRLRLRNGVVIESLGTGAKIRGRKNRHQRPTLVISDDLQNNEHILSPTQRERSWEWFVREVSAVGTTDTNYLTVGTGLHREAISCRLRSTAGWRSETFRSIMEWPVRMDVWREWEAILHHWDDPDREATARVFYDTNRAEMDRGAVVLWPERESLYDLMSLRASIGPAAFEAEKQNNPVNPTACEWPDDWFDHAAFWFDEWPTDLVVKTIALDPSKGRDASTGDPSAIVTYGVDVRGLEYVEADVKRRPVDRICEDFVEAVRVGKPEAAVLEANGFQELLAAPLRQAAAKAGVTLPLRLCENMVNKHVRIRRLTQPLAERRMRFKRRSPGTQLLVQQMRDFPVGDHDDGPDALEMARRQAVELVNGRQRKSGTRRVGV